MAKYRSSSLTQPLCSLYVHSIEDHAGFKDCQVAYLDVTDLVFFGVQDSVLRSRCSVQDDGEVPGKLGSGLVVFLHVARGWGPVSWVF